jgi:hypothetical protein
MSFADQEYSRLAFQSTKVMRDHGLAAAHLDRRAKFMRSHGAPILLDLESVTPETTEVQALRLAEKVAKAVHRASDDALRASAHHFADAMCQETQCAKRGPQWDAHVAAFMANADKEGARDEMFSHVVGHQLPEEDVRPMRLAMRFSFKKMFKSIGSGIKKAASAVGKVAVKVGKGVVQVGKFVVKNAPTILKTIKSGVACVGSMGASVGSCAKAVTGIGKTVFAALEAGKVKLPKWAQTVKKGVDIADTAASFIPGLRMGCEMDYDQQQPYLIEDYGGGMRFAAAAEESCTEACYYDGGMRFAAAEEACDYSGGGGMRFDAAAHGGGCGC